MPSLAIGSPSLLSFAWNQLNERNDHGDATRPDHALPDIFDMLPGTNASAGEVNTNGPEADRPDAFDPLIRAVTNAGTVE